MTIRMIMEYLWAPLLTPFNPKTCIWMRSEAPISLGQHDAPPQCPIQKRRFSFYIKRVPLLTPFNGPPPICDGLFKKHLPNTSLKLSHVATAMLLRIASSRLVHLAFGSFQRLIVAPLLLCLLVVLAGCESPFALDEFDQKNLAVSGYFTPSPPLPGFLVFVSPVNYFDGSEGQPLLSNADVGIYEGSQRVATLVAGTLQGRPVFYRGDFTPLEGVPYRLLVKADGYNTLQAVDRLPSKVEARWLGRDSMFITAFPDGRVGYDIAVSLEIQDPDKLPNYYHVFVEAWLKDASGAPVFILADLLQQEPSDPAVRPYLLGQSMLLDGTYFAGEQKKLSWLCRFEVPPGFDLSHLMLDMRHVSAHYYRFHRSHIDQLNTGTNPIVEPSVLTSNVNGGFGFFAGYHAARDSLPIP
jgi:hypothetical protein